MKPPATELDLSLIKGVDGFLLDSVKSPTKRRFLELEKFFEIGVSFLLNFFEKTNCSFSVCDGDGSCRVLVESSFLLAPRP